VLPIGLPRVIVGDPVIRIPDEKVYGFDNKTRQVNEELVCHESCPNIQG
jgi:hypothetical protein